MEEKNIGLCVWKNFYKTIKMLPKKEQQGLALAILDYAFSGETGDLSLMQKLALEPMKQTLKVRSFGGAPKGNSNAKKTTVDTTVDLEQNNCYSTVDSTDKTTVIQQLIQKERKEKEKENDEKKNNNKINKNIINIPPKQSLFPLENKKTDKNPYGEFGKVKLTNEEHTKLATLYGDKLDEAIQVLDDYIAQKGDKYKSHYAVLKTNNWVYEKVFVENKIHEQNQEYGNRPQDCYL